MLKASIRDDNPILFTESIALYPKPGPVTEDPDFTLPIGKGDIKREGSDVTLVTYARGVDWSMAAAKGWLRPLDTELIAQSFKKTNRCVVVEESLPMYSFGSEIAAFIQDELFDYMDAPVKRVSAMDVPLPFARDIELMALPNAQKVIEAVKEIV
jgi:pyruvate dehydrogenase E1 component beta subunit